MNDDNMNKSKNNKIALGGLVAMAALCIGVSSYILYLNPTDAKQLITVTFAPVGLVVGGLLGFIKH